MVVPGNDDQPSEGWCATAASSVSEPAIWRRPIDAAAKPDRQRRKCLRIDLRNNVPVVPSNPCQHFGFSENLSAARSEDREDFGVANDMPNVPISRNNVKTDSSEIISAARSCDSRLTKDAVEMSTGRNDLQTSSTEIVSLRQRGPLPASEPPDLEIIEGTSDIQRHRNINFRPAHSTKTGSSALRLFTGVMLRARNTQQTGSSGATSVIEKRALRQANCNGDVSRNGLQKGYTQINLVAEASALGLASETPEIPRSSNFVKTQLSEPFSAVKSQDLRPGNDISEMTCSRNFPQTGCSDTLSAAGAPALILDNCTPVRLRSRNIQPTEFSESLPNAEQKALTLVGDTPDKLRYILQSRTSETLPASAERPTNVKSAVAFFETKIKEQSNVSPSKIRTDKVDRLKRNPVESSRLGASDCVVNRCVSNRSCQRTHCSDPSHTNCVCTESVDNDNSASLLRQDRVRTRRIQRSETYCYHYPNICPGNEDKASTHLRSHSDQYFNKVQDDPELRIYQKRQKIEVTLTKAKFLSMKRLKDIKERRLVRRGSKKDTASAEEEKENAQMVRRTSSKRKRLKQVKRERQQCRRLDTELLNAYLNVPNKTACCEDELKEGTQLSDNWRIRLDICRGKLEMIIRRVEEILQCFVRDGIMDHQLFYNMRHDFCNMHKLMLDFVIEKGEKGYHCFVDALRETKQCHLAKLLENEDYDVDVSHHESLNANMSRLVSDLITGGELLAKLAQERLLNDEEMQKISIANVTECDKNRQLLYFIYRSSREQFDVFRECLRICHFEHLSKLLELSV